MPATPRRARLLRLAAALLLVAVAVAQAVPVERSNPPVVADLPAPPDVHALLQRACYDCHSHETRWPWYSGVAPASWLVAEHVREGRAELNFSRWSPAPERASDVLAEGAELVAEGEMPPASYVALHPEARLAPDDQSRLVAWLAQAGGGAGGEDDGEEDGL
jgi:hypothetical protein